MKYKKLFWTFSRQLEFIVDCLSADLKCGPIQIIFRIFHRKHSEFSAPHSHERLFSIGSVSNWYCQLPFCSVAGLGYQPRPQGIRIQRFWLGRLTPDIGSWLAECRMSSVHICNVECCCVDMVRTMDGKNFEKWTGEESPAKPHFPKSREKL